jgi:hypothetical protein
LGGSFTDTNSLLGQISALANGSSTTGNGPTAVNSSGDASKVSAIEGNSQQQQKISSLLAGVFQTEQQDFLSLLI